MGEFAITLSLLIIATIFDVKARKIPNWLTFPYMLFGVMYTIIFKRQEIMLLIISLAALFAMGCFSVVGWGDVKCLMAIVSITDWKTTLFSFLLSQALMIIHYLIVSPKKATKDIKYGSIQIASYNIQIDHKGERKIMAPYLMIGYIVLSIIFLFI